MIAPQEEPESTVDDFTVRGITALVLESAEIREAARRFSAVVTALALANGISTEV